MEANLNSGIIMERIVKIQNDGHVGLKQSLNSSKCGHEKNSNWHINRHCLVFSLSRLMLTLKVFGIKELFLILDMRSFVLQACASLLFNIGSIIFIIGAELKATAQKYFKKLFVFFMNDKIVHADYQSIMKDLFATSSIERYKS